MIDTFPTPVISIVDQVIIDQGTFNNKNYKAHYTIPKGTVGEIHTKKKIKTDEIISYYIKFKTPIALDKKESLNATHRLYRQLFATEEELREYYDVTPTL